MLSRSQENRLWRHGLTYLHDAASLKILLGEPTLLNGLLCYHDGRVVTLCGYPLRDEVPGPDSYELAARSLMTDVQPFEALALVGPWRMESLPDKELVSCMESSSRLLADLFLTLDDYSFRNIRAFKQARRREGLRTVVDRERGFSAHHLRLLEHFLASRWSEDLESNLNLMEYAVSLWPLAALRQAEMINIYEGSRLCGFSIWRHAFRDVGIGSFIMTDGTPYASDALVSASLESARRRNISFFNLAPSLSYGQYRFKVKWKAYPLVGVPVIQVFAREGARLENLRSYWTRLFFPLYLKGRETGRDN